MTAPRALLMTDVVDSTRLAEAIGEAAAAALWTAHDRAARDLLRRWNGREIDKTDGLLALFDAPADALGYALDYHRALAALVPPLTARAAIDFAPVALRENAEDDLALGAKPLDVDGLAKVVVARVVPLAGGGQTLITARAREALGAAPRLASHGHWRLKGLAEPVELFEAAGPGAPRPPPQDTPKAYRVVRQGDLWLPRAEVPRHLPAERDAFVGREALLQELARRYDEGGRLVSILGIGGAGKTRLATRFAWSWLGEFPGGAWFCDLSAARDSGGIARAVAESLDVPLDANDAVARLGQVIAGRGRCLVVLDNFEQVARHAEETVGRWLDAAREACFLVTTREVLGVVGEQTLALAPLPVPEAVRLFVQRARAVRSDFAADEEPIAELVRLLDGLPLAIELAAARSRLMAPHAMLARMGDRFRLLASGGGRHDRQATLRATLDWSWDQLAEWEKAALAQLSVFEGSFALDAAEAVLDLDAFDGAPWAVDALQSLVQKSLLRALEGDRFDLLSSVQEYAAQHLRASGAYAGSGPAAARAAEQRHGAWFAVLDERRAAGARTADLGNLVAACRRAIARGDGRVAADALAGAWAALNVRGPYGAALDLAEAVLAMPALDTAQRARAERVRGVALSRLGRVEAARAVLLDALRLARDAGDGRNEARTLVNLGDLERNASRLDEARGHLQAALRLAAELGDTLVESECLNALGSVESDAGRFDEAQAHYESGLALARRLGDRRWEAGILGNIGILHHERGRLDDAEACYLAALEAARAHGHRFYEGNMLCNLGFLSVTRGQPGPARSRFEAALRIAHESGHAFLECVALGNLSIALEALGEVAAAKTGFEAAIEMAGRLGERRYEGQFRGYLAGLHARAGRHAAALSCLEAAEALLRGLDDRLGLGVVLATRAEAHARAGDDAAAREALAAAHAIAEETRAGPHSELGQALERVAHRLAGAGVTGS